MTTTLKKQATPKVNDSFAAMSPQELKPLLDHRAVVLIDVREPDERLAARIDGSLSMPLSKLDPAAVPPNPDSKRIVLHCKSGRRSAEAAQRFSAAGFANVCQLAGGIDAWIAADLPVTRTAKAPISIMRQVQITAGSIVFLGTLLGAFVSPWFLLLSGFIGAGLVFAGISGTCGLASLLSMMPWNRAIRCGACCEK